MTSINDNLVIDLEKNIAKSVYIDAINVLLKLLDNIVREPDNIKYRKIKLENKIIKEKLLVLYGVINLLKGIGFMENSEGDLVLSSNVLIAKVKKYRDFISQRLIIVKSNDHMPSASHQIKRQDVTKEEPTIEESTSGAVRKRKLKKQLVCLGIPYLEKITLSKVLQTANHNLKYLEHLSDSFMQYEDKQLQEYTKNIIPLEKLKRNTLERIRNVQIAIVKENKSITEPIYEEVFLTELLDWFNNSFFTWVNEIRCKNCKKLKKATNTTTENGIRVESIICCGVKTCFNRYNDVSVLIQTRQGRCGEYANCFTFLCRCLGFDARFVLGNFDHVWTEVYSHTQKRWIHFDPSENVCDAPLIYEHGWHRDVSYVFGFSVDDIQDVTWRYTSDYEKTRNIRDTYDESELLKSIIHIRTKRQSNMSERRKKFLKIRNLIETASFLTPRQPSEDEKAGRSSGSLDWRLSRGEQTIKKGFVFTLNHPEKSLKQFSLRYSCSKNKYERFVYDTKEIIETYKNWETCTYESENVFYKKENDWKMVYLARTEDTFSAKLSWNFDFSADKLKVKTAKLIFQTKTYENGKINLKFINYENPKTVLHNIEKLKNLSKFSILVEMSGGVGKIAWQHTQLFRQELDSDDYPFELFIELY